MGDMGLTPEFWKGRRVFLTGHTGFKGSWLALWLAGMGARVTGYALNPPTEPSLFDQADVAGVLEADIRGDIRDKAALNTAMATADPEVLIHMAAQPLVSDGYTDPIGTYETNVIGTGNVLLAAFAAPNARSIVSVATDKCYENREWVHPYRETDPMGGHDPYSSSKGAAEILTASFTASLPHAANVGSVRAGNVVGGGDWADMRLVPDCVRAFAAGTPVVLRRPDAVRPWQHVLEPLAGYLMLAEALAGDDGKRFQGGWNFGPAAGGELPVAGMAHRLAAAWGPGADVVEDPDSSAMHEAHLLRLDSTKARVELGWVPVLDAGDTIDWIAAWYRGWHEGADLAALTRTQIAAFAERLV